MNKARAMCFHADLPLNYWDEFSLMSCYLIVRTPSQAIAGKTPLEL
jgi:hypothetical protein